MHPFNAFSMLRFYYEAGEICRSSVVKRRDLTSGCVQERLARWISSRRVVWTSLAMSLNAMVCRQSTCKVQTFMYGYSRDDGTLKRCAEAVDALLFVLRRGFETARYWDIAVHDLEGRLQKASQRLCVRG